MATLYKYSILITFAHPNPNLEGVRTQVSYGPLRGQIDVFRFNKRSVRIIAIRAKKIPDTQQDLYGKPNAVNNQIQKAIEYYYITCPQLTRVSSITISYGTKRPFGTYQNADKYQQPLSYKRGAANSWMLTPAVASDILLYGGNGPTYRIALSYCLRAAVETNDFTIFSLLWRAFNALYRQGAHSTKDSDGLNFIKRVINSNYTALSLSNTMIVRYRIEFASLRWNKFIHNKVSFDASRRRSRQDGIGTRTFLTQYFDGGINSYFEQLLTDNISLSNRINLLRGTNVQTIKTHLRQNGIRGGFRDPDMLIILVKEYAYFLRNTLFHGAVDEPSFTLGEIQEKKELGMAKMWMENIIKDLLNNHLI